jgi:hypothetical protein
MLASRQDAFETDEETMHELSRVVFSTEAKLEKPTRVEETSNGLSDRVVKHLLR